MLPRRRSSRSLSKVISWYNVIPQKYFFIRVSRHTSICVPYMVEEKVKVAQGHRSSRCPFEAIKMTVSLE